MNPYLKRKRDEYTALNTAIQGIQTRAAEENRDLTEDELRSVTEQTATAKKVASEIELLTEQENRSASVAEMGANLRSGTEQNGGTQTRTALGVTAKDRDPGHYRSEAEGGRHSFFGDLWSSKQGDQNAAQRLTEHQRALNPTDNGVGLVAPRWMTELSQPLARQGRVLANAVRSIPLGNDPRPITIPKTTVGTDAVVTELEDNCGDTTWTDAYDTDVDTISPVAVTGGQVVCRSMIDSASPAIDALIFGDLLAVYDEKVEARVANAIVTAAGAPVETFADEAAFSTEQDALDAIIDAEMAVWTARKLPADLLVMRTRRLGYLRKLRDADGRPLIPASAGGIQAVNANGVMTSQITAMVEGLLVTPTSGMGTVAYPESLVVQRSQDVLLFESSEFRFNDPFSQGPSKVRLAIWAYVATHVRYAGASGKRIVITEADGES